MVRRTNVCAQNRFLRRNFHALCWNVVLLSFVTAHSNPLPSPIALWKLNDRHTNTVLESAAGDVCPRGQLTANTHGGQPVAAALRHRHGCGDILRRPHQQHHRRRLPARRKVAVHRLGGWHYQDLGCARSGVSARVRERERDQLGGAAPQPSRAHFWRS